MLKLSIQHNIYLNKNQRYDLNNNIDVDTIGISIPIWHLGRRNSEPKKEILCNYYLRNPNKELPIRILKDGYIVCLPFKIPQRKQRDILKEEWLTLSQEQREAYYTASSKDLPSFSLLDIKDGGSESFIYKESNTIKAGDEFMKVIHHVNILDFKYLKSTVKI